MYETMVTLVGNAATAVEHRQTAAGASAVRFRLATSSRRFDRERDCWVDGDASFYTVRAWRSLADHVAASVSCGEPLIVHGRMKVWDREHPEEKGRRRVSVEVDAVAVGHDMSRGTSAFRRTVRARTDLMPPAGTAAPPGQREPAPPDGAPDEPDWSAPHSATPAATPATVPAAATATIPAATASDSCAQAVP
ncbi:single-stranded DNA-binding protein [Streptomyces sp. NPDC017056]|uniref:single-stranded DNA-binding protein n=1 Tax=Streptomyces sp. NPDC017056 TaxID=3364973 RepID=UPI00379FB5E6